MYNAATAAIVLVNKKIISLFYFA